MGLRFRKSIKVLPGVRLNLNKGSHSWTVGGKAARVTVNTKKGYTTQSVNLPGGLGYTNKSKIEAKEIEEKPPKPKMPIYKRKWFIAIVALFILGIIAEIFS